MMFHRILSSQDLLESQTFSVLNSTFMNLKIAWLVLNAKCEIVVFTQCSRQCLLCDNQNIVHLVALIFICL